MIAAFPAPSFIRLDPTMTTGPEANGSSFSQPPGIFSDGLRHEPVMVDEILADLGLAPGATVVDATVGLGGHSARFVEAIRPGGTLVGLDWDEAMLERARQRLGEPEGVRIVLVRDDFRNMASVLDRLGMRAHGILLDLGLNSAQVDDPERGFSFRESGPLDMRMDASRSETAAAMLNRMTPAQLEVMLRDFGDEKWARRIAQAIVERRKTQPLRTTGDLVECVLAAIPPRFRDKRIHPATRTFQAVRIAVNGELEGLDTALTEAAWCLAQEGVVSVLSYHSGEDRIVKNVFRDLAREGFLELHRKPVTATEDEIRRNPRARSAKLRSLRRLPIDSATRKQP